MKKFIIITLGLLILPSITLASWWNPISWFNGWSFSEKTEVKTEVLEKRIQDLEEKISDKRKIEELEQKLSEKQKTVSVKTNTASPAPVKNEAIVIKTNNVPTVLVAETPNVNVCNDFKKDFSLLEQKYNTLSFQVKSIHTDGSISTSNDFDYAYKRFLAGQQAYYTKVSDFKLELSKLSEGFASEDVILLKQYYSQAADLYKLAYDLHLSSYKYVNDDSYVFVNGFSILPSQNIDNAKKTLKEAGATFIEAIKAKEKGDSIYQSIKQKYTSELINKKCN